MSVEYRCDRCGIIHEVNDGLLAFYQLADGRSFCGPYATGWCCHCRELSDVEEIPNPADLRGRLAQLDEFSAIHHQNCRGGNPRLQRSSRFLRVLGDRAKRVASSYGPSGPPAGEKPPGAKMEPLAITLLKSGTISSAVGLFTWTWRMAGSA
jgi:hypothetical protein